MHAHPDDEAIFTGLTLRRLADAGARVVLVMATGGDLGGSRLPLAPGEDVPARRRRELEDAAALLGVDRLVLLGHRDSGLPGGPGTAHPRALAGADPVVLGRTVAELVDAEGAGTVIHDDDAGIYGHPDHRAAHAAGAIAVTLTGATGYRMTVDREHLALSARDRHLVHGAARAAGVPFGRVTAEIAVAVGGTDADLAVKRDAMLAHASQIDPAAVPAATFADAYGYEWFLRGERDGAATAPGVLDALGNAHLLAGAR
nr:PIG-L deacetylase family protein [Pseudonocardia sp. C8]